jgi:hypothetical protein
MPDNRLVKKKHLRDITVDLWDKAKKKFAKLDEPNIFQEENIFKDDAIIESREMYAGELYDIPKESGGQKKMGRRDYTSHSHGNTGYVKSLVIKTNGNVLQDGATTRVKVWSVEKNTILTTDHISVIVPEGDFNVKKYDDKWGNCVEIPIEKYFDKETYFIYQFMQDSSHTVCHTSIANDNYIYLEDQENVDFNTLNNHNGKDTVGIYGIIGGESVRQHIKDCVETWGDLEYVTDHKYVNMVNYNNKITGSYDGQQLVPDGTNNWNHVKVDVQESQTYTLLKRHNDSSVITFLDRNDAVVGKSDTKKYFDSYWYRNTFEVPSNPVNAPIAKVAISFKTDGQTNPKANEIMLLKGEVKEDLPFIPYIDGDKIVEIGTEVGYKFDKKDTDLTSKYVDDAIRELARKLQGSVQSDKVHIVENNAALTALLQGDTVKDKDIIHIKNSTDVRDFNNDLVNNGTRPVTMLFDDTIQIALPGTPNKLRVISKVDSHLDMDNVFTGRNTFNTVYLGGPDETEITVTPLNPRNPSNIANIKWGARNLSSGANNNSGYVKSLQMGVAQTDQNNVGITLEVSIWEVRKVLADDKTQDEPTLIADKIKLPILEKNNWLDGHSRYVEYRINKHYNNDTYFIYSFTEANKAARVNSANNTNNANYIYLGEVDDVTKEKIATSTGNQSMGFHKLVVGNVDVADLTDNSYIDSSFNNDTRTLRFTRNDGTIKEHIIPGGNAAIGNIELKYSSQERELTLSVDGQETKVQEKLDDLASQKIHSNTFEKANYFHNGYIKGNGTDYALVYRGLNSTIQEAQGRPNTETKCWWTCDQLMIKANTTVTDLIVQVKDIGEDSFLINDILIRAAKHTKTGTGPDDNEFTAGKVLFSGKAIAKRNLSYPDLGVGTFVEIPLNKRVEEDTILMVQVPGSLVGNNNNGHLCQKGFIEMYGENDVFPVSRGAVMFYGNAKIVSQDIPFEDLINKKMPILIEDVYNLENRLNAKYDKTDFTAEGGDPRIHAGLPVKLNPDGMIDESMLPVDVNNNYWNVDEFTEEGLEAKAIEYLIGDYFHHNKTGERYVCIRKEADLFEEKFIKFEDMINRGWEDLEFAKTTHSFQNLFDKRNGRIEILERRVLDNGTIEERGSTKVFIVKVEKDTEYYITNNKIADGTHPTMSDSFGSDLIVFYDRERGDFGINSFVGRDFVNTQSSNVGATGKKALKFRTHANATHVAFMINDAKQPTAKEGLMIWKVGQGEPTEYEQYNKLTKVALEGEKATVEYVNPIAGERELQAILKALADRPAGQAPAEYVIKLEDEIDAANRITIKNGNTNGPTADTHIDLSKFIKANRLTNDGTTLDGNANRKIPTIDDTNQLNPLVIPNLPSNKINLLTGYDTVGDVNGDLANTDNLNQALKKLEKKADAGVKTVNGQTGAVGLQFIIEGDSVKLEANNNGTANSVNLAYYTEADADTLILEFDK